MSILCVATARSHTLTPPVRPSAGYTNSGTFSTTSRSQFVLNEDSAIFSVFISFLYIYIPCPLTYVVVPLRVWRFSQAKGASVVLCGDFNFSPKALATLSHSDHSTPSLSRITPASVLRRHTPSPTTHHHQPYSITNHTPITNHTT